MESEHRHHLLEDFIQMARIAKAVLHEVPADVVDDDGVGHALVGEFLGGQAGTLVARAGLIDPDVNRNPGALGGIDRSGGRAPVGEGQPAGIAVS